jgi:hypothetical protein
MERDHQQPLIISREIPNTFKLSNIIPLENDYILDISSINQSGTSFEAINLNFLDRLSKKHLKFKHSGKSLQVSEYALKIEDLALKLPETFKDLEAKHLPSSTFSSIIKTYFVSLSQRFSKEHVKKCLKKLLKKLIAHKLAPKRTEINRKIKNIAVLEKKNAQLAKLQEMESSNTSPTLKEQKKKLSNLRKKKTLLELRGLNVHLELENDINSCMRRIQDMKLDEAPKKCHKTTSSSDSSDSDSDDELQMDRELSNNFLRNIQSLCFGWIESVKIPEGVDLNRSIVFASIPAATNDLVDFIIQLVNSLRLYYPRYETLKTSKELNKTQCIPFLSLTNWIFSKLDYTDQIKKFIPQISVGKLWALSLNKDTIYELFLHKKAGLFIIDGNSFSNFRTKKPPYGKSRTNVPHAFSLFCY